MWINLFLSHQHISQQRAVRTPSEKQLNLGPPSRRGFVPEFLKKPIDTCYFPRVQTTCPLLDPPMTICFFFVLFCCFHNPSAGLKCWKNKWFIKAMCEKIIKTTIFYGFTCQLRGLWSSKTICLRTPQPSQLTSKTKHPETNINRK